MSVTPRGIFAASWGVGGLVFASTFIGAISYIAVASSFPFGFRPGRWELFSLIGAVILLMGIDLSALWILFEIGGLAGVVNFQPKFKSLSAGLVVFAAGLLGSFLSMVVITTAAFLVVTYLFK
jgi:hypothetical protein